MKQAFCSWCAVVMLTLASGALSSSQAQTPSATPEPFVIQLTSSPIGFRSSTSDISANGRLVVFESNGDVATDRSETRNNSDGNREIFIADYAQRRIFQITNTKNVPKPTPTPTPTPTPEASPTPTPVPTPADPTQIQIEISNNRPVISLEPALNASNQRVYTIVFSSNAPNPGNFDGVDTGGALALDGNQEIWIYQVPAIADVDLTSGANLPIVTLSGGAFTRITDTPATLVPTPGATGVAPQVADDNRDATISDDGSRLAFISNADLVPAVPNANPPLGNADRNPELFFFNRGTGAFAQATVTQDTGGIRPFTAFQQNPSLSADGSRVAFLSSANLAGSNDDGNGRGNAEVYIATYNGSAISNIQQATRTIGEASTVNLFSPGRRLSRDGSLVAFESLAADPKANSATNEAFHAVFVYNIGTDTFVQVGPRSTGGFGDIIRFPTFTDYNATLQPATLVFASALNFRTDGTFPPADQASTGLNPNTVSQIFATQAAATPGNTFTRLTKHPAVVQANGDFLVGIRPLPSNTRQRITYSHGGTELGTGNPDKFVESFYLLSPPVATELSAPLSFFTGASEVPLPTPEASPTPSPSPGSVTGLAPGEVAIVRTTVEFAPSPDPPVSSGSEISRSPALPTELNGVSVSVNGAAAGLYFVGSTSMQVNFVVPIGVSPGVATVVINSRINGGTQLRGAVEIVPAQPDIFSQAGRAAVVNVTNPMARTGEPFSVTSLDSTGMSVPTVLEISLTGVRGATPAEVKVTVGTTDITGAEIVLVRSNPEMPGWDIINFTLPASLAGSPNVPVIVTITRGTGVFSSRPAATAPLITISP